MHTIAPYTSQAFEAREWKSDRELPAQPLRALGLTTREAEVLLWISQGKRNGEIAAILETSKRTVDKHAQRIFCKLMVETRTAAAIIAFKVLALDPKRDKSAKQPIFR